MAQSGRWWSARAGTSEHTLRRALAGDRSIGFGNVEALLVAADCKFTCRFPNDEGGYTVTVLNFNRPLREAVDCLLWVAERLGRSGVEWAKKANVSESTIRRLRKRDPNIGIGILARLLDSASCSVARDYRREPPLVIDPDDFSADNSNLELTLPRN